MPSFTVGKLREEFEAEGLAMEEASVLLLGLTYRPGVEEIRASPSLTIAEELAAAGANVYGVDPLLDDVGAFDLDGIALENVYEHDFDGVVLVTPHDEFEDIDWDRLGRAGGSVVIDGRATLALGETDHRVYTIGGS
jgi:UDP-N-acetyl-D-mannosaminuronic acid dehydrogenase